MKTHIKYSLIAWLFFASIVGWVISSVSNAETAFIRTASFVIPQMALFFLNLSWLGPKYNSGKLNGKYILILVLLVAAHVALFAPFDLWMDDVLPLEFNHMDDRPVGFVFFGRLMSSVPPIIISSLIWKSYLLQKQTKESFELKNRMLQAETKALKAQINPHFLFNSLNNIYALTQIKSDKAGDAVLNLSEILRFVTYESEKDFVNLNEELAQIKSFIALQFLKDEDQSNVKIEISEDISSAKIAPMLILPLIENAFKHSNFESKGKGWIKLKIDYSDSHLLLEISNSKSKELNKKDKTGGVGLENVKRRLELIYPQKHNLKIEENNLEYYLVLNLDLSK